MENLKDLVTYVMEKTNEQPLAKLEFRPFIFNDGTVIVWKDDKDRRRIRIVLGAPERIDFTLDARTNFDNGFEYLKEFEYVEGDEKDSLLVHFNNPKAPSNVR